MGILPIGAVQVPLGPGEYGLFVSLVVGDT
jgi:hypothetical protein